MYGRVSVEAKAIRNIASYLKTLSESQHSTEGSVSTSAAVMEDIFTSMQKLRLDLYKLALDDYAPSKDAGLAVLPSEKSAAE